MKKFTIFFATLFCVITMFAANITDGTKLYLKPNNNWKIDGARFAAYFFGGDGELWVSMTDSNNDGIYEVTCQGTRENVIFCRMNPASTDNTWDNKWNQTGDLTWDGTKCQYNVPEEAWDNSGNEYWVELGNNDTPNNPDQPQEVTSYTLCGDFPFLNWETANSANHMTKGNDGVWTKTYENQSLEAKTYQYKVAANNIWDNNQFPQGMVNQEYTINEAGSYTVTFSFNPATPELKCEATKTGNNPGGNDNPTYTFTDGTQLYLNPSEEWKSEGARFAAYFFGGDGELWVSMPDTNGDGIYEVTCQGTREKVIFCRMNPEFTDNGWNTGSEGENDPKRVWNQTADLTYDGTNNQYNVSGWDAGEWSVFSGNNGNGGNDNPDNPDNPEKPQPEASIYTLCGDPIIFGTEWDETDTNNDMTKGSDGIWIKEYTDITLTKGSYEYKVVAGHNWDTVGKYPSDDSNMTLYISKDGIYDLKFTFDPTIPELKATAESKVNVENITINNIYTINGFVHADTDITIYTITGQDVTSQNGNLENGIYIIKTQNKTSKLIINN